MKSVSCRHTCIFPPSALLNAFCCSTAVQHSCQVLPDRKTPQRVGKCPQQRPHQGTALLGFSTWNWEQFASQTNPSVTNLFILEEDGEGESSFAAILFLLSTSSWQCSPHLKNQARKHFAAPAFSSQRRGSVLTP